MYMMYNEDEIDDDVYFSLLDTKRLSYSGVLYSNI